MVSTSAPCAFQRTTDCCFARLEERSVQLTDVQRPLQDAKPGDKQLLNAQCEPLLMVAEAHADGKESFARSIATELFSDFLSVEERFAANKEATEQEVIDSLRQVESHSLENSRTREDLTNHQ